MNSAKGGEIKENKSRLGTTYGNLIANTFFRFLVILLGLPVHIVTVVLYKLKNSKLNQLLNEQITAIKESEQYENLIKEYEEQYRSKKEFFQEEIKASKMKQEATKLANERVKKIVLEEFTTQEIQQMNYHKFFIDCLSSRTFLAISFIPGILMYLFLFTYCKPVIRYIFERLWMTIFVIALVTVFVFSILYFSPSDPAAHILGESSTAEQRAEFNHQYGLDQPYWVQLWDTVKGIATFNLGYSYTGNEDVIASIANKFPITLTIAFWSLLMAIVLAIPVGMISAAKRNSIWDYSLMFIALIGLSIPNFWQGLLFILNFSIKWHILPATYSPNDWLSMIMPVIVLGTGMTASIARMTRSSLLEVINEDYIVTAKAKGLKPKRIFFNHALRNALIPIITLIGLEFGGMLGGAAVTEKVFNISGIGSYIVDKQFIPDIPAILGGVVYVAITISIVNLVIDILYALVDPRIRSQLKST